jgi:chemotaxis regulatin CheY-phosphate phosphatase CheZ
MTARHELLYDTEASLRLVDHELTEHRDAIDEAIDDAIAAEVEAPDGSIPLGAALPATGSAIASLPSLLERVTAEIQTVLASLRDSRDSLQTATVEKIQRTSEKLREVTSTTESATTDILDALDRAQTLVDDLDAADDEGDRDRSRSTRDLLREEIFAIMNSLQFQDITNQQLAYAASVLTDMEDRLVALAKLFDPSAALAHAAGGAPDPRTFDPNATVRKAEERQALADSIFAR